MFKFNADCVAVDIGLLISEILSTLPNPTIDLLIPFTVPVNVGLAILAFKLIALFKVVLLLVNVASLCVFVYTSEELDFKTIALYISVLLFDNFVSLSVLLYTSIIFALVLILLVKLAVVISLSTLVHTSAIFVFSYIII